MFNCLLEDIYDTEWRGKQCRNTCISKTKYDSLKKKNGFDQSKIEGILTDGETLIEDE